MQSLTKGANAPLPPGPVSVDVTASAPVDISALLLTADRKVRGDADDVFCAGDVAAWPHPMAEDSLIRIEHWTNAAEQGAAAARNLLAAPADYGADIAVGTMQPFLRYTCTSIRRSPEISRRSRSG